MRLWTLHPRHLDPQGLVALWREALLAQKVLANRTKGYRHHPQLIRFRNTPDPLKAIAAYLQAIHEEAVRRGYRFDRSKIQSRPSRRKITETRGQLHYEWKHLKRKLRVRQAGVYRCLLGVKHPTAHPLFKIVPGQVRDWERRF